MSVKQVVLVGRLQAIYQVDWLRAFGGILVSHVWFGAASFLQVTSWMHHFFGWLFLLSIAGMVLLVARKPGKGESVHDHSREQAARFMRGTSRLSPSSTSTASV